MTNFEPPEGTVLSGSGGSKFLRLY